MKFKYSKVQKEQEQELSLMTYDTKDAYKVWLTIFNNIIVIVSLASSLATTAGGNIIKTAIVFVH